MCVCMGACVCMDCVCVHTHMCMCLCVCVCTGLMCVCVCCACVHTCTGVYCAFCMCVCMGARMCVHRACVHTCTCVCVCECVCLCERPAGSRRGPARLGRGFKAAFPTAGVSAPDKQPGAERCRRLAGCVSELLAGSQKAVPGPLYQPTEAGGGGGREGGKSICFSP